MYIRILYFFEILHWRYFISGSHLVQQFEGSYMYVNFEGSIYRDRHACAYTASIVSLLILYARINVRVHTYNIAVTLYHVAKFRGRRNF